jgi:hypothetical protein
MFINLFHSDLVAGYRKVKNYRHALLSKWRPKLLRAYAQKWQLYAQKREAHLAREKNLQRLLRWLAPVLLLLGVSSCLLTSTSFAQLAGLLFGGVLLTTLAVLGIWGIEVVSRPKPPQNPLAQSAKNAFVAPLKKELFPDLVFNWRLGLKIPIPTEMQVKAQAEQTEKWGLIGEFILIRKLAEAVSPNTVILHSVMPKPRDDMDVIVIGPKGLWYFEVKYENAEFSWHNGEWQVWKFDHQAKKPVRSFWKEYPDAQWYRMRTEALENLKTRAPALAAKYPNAIKINGGIVFAHPEVTFDIDKSPPFLYGNPGGMVTKYQSAPNLPEMTPEMILYLTEILLAKHQALNPGRPVNSMNVYAETVIRRAEQKLENWVKAP